MGYDLYWIRTPQPEDEKLNDFDEQFFTELWDIEWDDRRDKLDGKLLNKENLEELKATRKTLQVVGKNQELVKMITAMIDEIEKNGSLTIVCRG